MCVWYVRKGLFEGGCSASRDISKIVAAAIYNNSSVLLFVFAAVGFMSFCFACEGAGM